MQKGFMRQAKLSTTIDTFGCAAIAGASKQEIFTDDGA
jgi:hypothetical protein